MWDDQPMNEKERNVFLKNTTETVSKLLNINIDLAKDIVTRSSLEKCLKEISASYMGHYVHFYWAEDVWSQAFGEDINRALSYLDLIGSSENRKEIDLAITGLKLLKSLTDLP